MNPKVSVCITAYNHEKYISQALDSVLMQETDFDYEVLIGEDDSSDNTRTIVKEYTQRYPDKIRMFLNDRKNVICINGRPTGRWNFVNNLMNAKGEYISLLDGDDYWTDPFKLQKQFDYLAMNPSYSTCIHNVKVVYENSTIVPHPHFQQQVTGPNSYKKPNYTSTLIDLMHGNFIPTASVMFRSGIFQTFPLWYYKCSMGDWPLHVLNSKIGGPIGYLDEVMGVYRVHAKSIWSSSQKIVILLNSISTAKHIKNQLTCRSSDQLNKTIAQWHEEVIDQMLLNKNRYFYKSLDFRLFFNLDFYTSLRVIKNKVSRYLYRKWRFNYDL